MQLQSPQEQQQQQQQPQEPQKQQQLLQLDTAAVPAQEDEGTQVERPAKKARTGEVGGGWC
jgi:hypothetical protein